MDALGQRLVLFNRNSQGQLEGVLKDFYFLHFIEGYDLGDSLFALQGLVGVLVAVAQVQGDVDVDAVYRELVLNFILVKLLKEPIAAFAEGTKEY